MSDYRGSFGVMSYWKRGMEFHMRVLVFVVLFVQMLFDKICWQLRARRSLHIAYHDDLIVYVIV